MCRLGFLAMILLSWFCATPALSADKWISSSGSGTVCSRSAPCDSLAVALTAANDNIHCVDTGVFAGFYATMPFSLTCLGPEMVTRSLYIQSSGPDSVTVLDGVSVQCTGMDNGIVFYGAGTLIVRNVKVRNCVHGISFVSSGAAKLVLRNVDVENCTGTGVYVWPNAASTVQVEIDGLRSVRNLGGVNIQAEHSMNIDVGIRNSILSENWDFGLVSAGASGVSVVFVDSTSILGNGNVGVYSTGSYSYVLVNNSTIARNKIGWAFAGGGTLASYGTNVVNNLSSYGGPSVLARFQ